MTNREVKISVYWQSSFYACFMARDEIEEPYLINKSVE